jgi:hypothetical protein
VAAPAALLAFVAWQSGDGALANVALDRALADDPRYSMALLLRQVITAGAPPSLARLPMTPEEVAASYDDAEAEPEDAGDGCHGGEWDDVGDDHDTDLGLTKRRPGGSEIHCLRCSSSSACMLPFCPFLAVCVPGRHA